MSDSDSRIVWIDFLKGICILWLIVYHMHVFDWMWSPVPVFFFLSGLFFSEGKSFKVFVKKKAFALLVPLLFFFVLGVVATALKCKMQGESYSFPPLWRFATIIPKDADIVNPMGVGAIWFLVSLFEIYVIYYALRLVSTNKWWLLMTGILLSFASCITMQYYAFGSLFYLFYTFGYCIYFIVAHLSYDKVIYQKIPIWLLLLSVAAYCLKFIDVSNLFDNNWMGVLGLRIKGLLSVFGLIVILIWLCKGLMSFKSFSESKMVRCVVFEGRNSLTILGLHMLAMGVIAILLKVLLPVGLLYHTLLFVLIVVVCNLFVFLFNRYVPFFVNHKKTT